MTLCSERPAPLRAARSLLDAVTRARPSEVHPRESLDAILTDAARGAWDRCQRDLDFFALLYSNASDVWFGMTRLVRLAVDLARYGDRREVGATWVAFETWAARVYRALGGDNPAARARALCAP